MEPGKKTAPIISLRGIDFGYPDRPDILNNLDFDLYPGERVGLVAPNGSGKTTLFHIIMGLLKPCAGELRIFGRPVRREQDFIKVRQRIGMLFQDADDQLFSPTVLEDVAFGPLNLGKSREEAESIARRTLARLGLEGFEERITFRLSGGEKRLVSLATILAMEPEVLLLDEPATGLDDQTRHTLTHLIGNLDLAYVLISHNARFLSATTDKTYSMEDGRILMDEEIHFHEHLHAHRHGQVPHQHK
ncbi:MAG: ABC transporter ATP-binding protein [Desulfosarcina sp.]|nr:ABC transporter ATP-binding protein [Desulfobacterales bacterium]